MNHNDITDFFSQIPPDTSSKFSIKIANFVKDFISLDHRRQIVDILKSMLSESDLSGDREFAIFYTLVVYYRMMRSGKKLKKLIDEYDNKFSNKPLFIYSQSAYELTKNTKDSYEKSLYLAKKCISIINDPTNSYDSEYTGFYNHYATVIVAFLEKNYEIDTCKIDLAYEYIKKCIITKDDYPTYYATLAKLELHDKKFESAIGHIQTAIDLEQDRGRISEYNDLLVKVEYKQTMLELEKKSEQVSQLVIENKKLIEENKINTLEYLGFFSGIIAFVITSANITVSNPDIAFRLILMFMGALLIGFSSFSLLIQHKERKINRIAITIIIGIVIIVFANWMIK